MQYLPETVIIKEDIEIGMHTNKRKNILTLKNQIGCFFFNLTMPKLMILIINTVIHLD